jgi:hypothetical protein
VRKQPSFKGMSWGVLSQNQPYCYRRKFLLSLLHNLPAENSSLCLHCSGAVLPSHTSPCSQYDDSTSTKVSTTETQKFELFSRSWRICSWLPLMITYWVAPECALHRQAESGCFTDALLFQWSIKKKIENFVTCDNAILRYEVMRYLSY